MTVCVRFKFGAKGMRVAKHRFGKSKVCKSYIFVIL